MSGSLLTGNACKGNCVFGVAVVVSWESNLNEQEIKIGKADSRHNPENRDIIRKAMVRIQKPEVDFKLENKYFKDFITFFLLLGVGSILMCTILQFGVSCRTRIR